MQQPVVENMRIYPASKYTKLGLWFRRKFFGHYVLEGKDLKSLLPKGRVDKKLIKNKRLYGVKLRVRK